MANDDGVPNYSPPEHAQHVEERKTLVEAARESSRTFDQAVLAFGSAVFGFSVAFLKDVAPHPQLYTLKWLAASWFLFSSGLLAILLSFLFSHKACMFEVEAGAASLLKPNRRRKENRWSAMTDWCNYSCIGLLFVGLLCWSVFAFENLGHQEKDINLQVMAKDKVEKGYVPPSPPPRVPPSPPATQPRPPRK